MIAYCMAHMFHHFLTGRSSSASCVIVCASSYGQVVYDSILDRSAKTAGFKFDPTKQQSRALARLACMANITDADKGKKLEEAFNQMEEDQRNTLSAYLAADGIHPNQKPGFGFQDARMFLQQAIQNSEVGPLAALLILRKVCEEVHKKYKDKSNPLLMVKLSRLATFAEEFKGSVTFQDMPFALELTSDGYALVIPKVWIPVRNEAGNLPGSKLGTTGKLGHRIKPLKQVAATATSTNSR
eukprot:symbB.v1.2.001357.t1/scaffold69.1/size353428/12